MKKYRCIPCGYIYNPAAGDADSGIAPGTAFVKICRTIGSAPYALLVRTISNQYLNKL